MHLVKPLCTRGAEERAEVPDTRQRWPKRGLGEQLGCHARVAVTAVRVGGMVGAVSGELVLVAAVAREADVAQRARALEHARARWRQDKVGRLGELPGKPFV